MQGVRPQWTQEFACRAAVNSRTSSSPVGARAGFGGVGWFDWLGWSGDAGICRSAYRLSDDPAYRYRELGFRAVLAPGR